VRVRVGIGSLPLRIQGGQEVRGACAGASESGRIEMKRMIFAALLSFAMLGATYAQGRSSNSGPTEKSCTTRESGWSVDVKVAEVHDRTRETSCSEKGPGEGKEVKESKESREGKQPRKTKEKH
jgi:hypothetical protein